MTDIATLELDHQPDHFIKSLVRHLSGALEDVIGLEDAEGLVSIVGQRIGDDINAQYRRGLAVDTLDRDNVTEVLVDLKRRIHGEFSVVEETDDKIVFENQRCPFGAFVNGRPSLCMMTSNVFGVIAAENLGYAKVDLESTIARGDGHCHVTLYLSRDAAASAAEGREYFASAGD